MNAGDSVIIPAGTAVPGTRRELVTTTIGTVKVVEHEKRDGRDWALVDMMSDDLDENMDFVEVVRWFPVDVLELVKVAA
ncbi:MAG: hypothetical protein AAGA99_00565 [Actinomycetota bacterium]